jgi:hypothetical protein
MGLLTTDRSALADAGFDASHLTWTGRPPSGLLLAPSDALAIPLSLLWGGFAIFWETTVVTVGAPWFFKLWGVPFVAVGLYLIVGRFFWDAYVRGNTFYALTDDGRAIIRRVGFGATTTVIDVTRLPEITFQSGSNGTGTIYFGRHVLWKKRIVSKIGHASYLRIGSRIKHRPARVEALS